MRFALTEVAASLPTTVLALALAACGGDGATSPRQPEDGAWSGTTSQGKSVAFAIAEGVFSSPFTIGYRVTGTCTVDGSLSVGAFVGSTAIDSFSVESAFFDSDLGVFTFSYGFGGRFGNSRSVSGSLSITDHQCGSANATWSAAR